MTVSSSSSQIFLNDSGSRSKLVAVDIRRELPILKQIDRLRRRISIVGEIGRGRNGREKVREDGDEIEQQRPQCRRPPPGGVCGISTTSTATARRLRATVLRPRAASAAGGSGAPSDILGLRYIVPIVRFLTPDEYADQVSPAAHPR